MIDSVKKVLRKRHRATDDFIGYWIPQRSFRRMERIEKVIKIALGGIAGFSLFVSCISIMNICLVSVGEKTREIGLRIIVFHLGEAEGKIRVKLQRIKGDRK